MIGKLIVTILLITAVPVAQAQNSRVSKADAEKAVTIIRGDKAKTQSYCAIGKLSKQIAQAKDKKMVDELFEKIDKLEESLGPEYVALNRWASGHRYGKRQARPGDHFDIGSTRQAVYEVSLKNLKAPAAARAIARRSRIMNPSSYSSHF